MGLLQIHNDAKTVENSYSFSSNLYYKHGIREFPVQATNILDTKSINNDNFNDPI